MGLLKRKPKIGIDDFCRQFYDSAMVAGTDVFSGYCEVAFNSVAEVDSSFESVNRDLFRREMTALRMELFGLAWMHHFKREKYLLPEIAFTKSYLEEKGPLEIWDTMLVYNQAIAKSGKEIVTGEQMRRGWVTSINYFRADLFNKWFKAGVDGECAARVANRAGTDVAWDKGITLKRLTARLADRLGCDINLGPEALFRLSAVIRGLYNGAKEAIESVNLQFPTNPILEKD